MIQRGDKLVSIKEPARFVLAMSGEQFGAFWGKLWPRMERHRFNAADFQPVCEELAAVWQPSERDML